MIEVDRRRTNPAVTVVTDGGRFRSYTIHPSGNRLQIDRGLELQRLSFQNSLVGFLGVVLPPQSISFQDFIAVLFVVGTSCLLNSVGMRFAINTHTLGAITKIAASPPFTCG